MEEKITSWQVLREDGHNCAWVNNRYIGVITDEQIAYLQKHHIQPTLRRKASSINNLLMRRSAADAYRYVFDIAHGVA